MSMNFSAEIEAKIREKVESGRYSDASAVVGEAMRLLIEREQLEHQRASREVGRQEELRGDPVEFAPKVDRESPSQR